jgi:hypothetical protein
MSEDVSTVVPAAATPPARIVALELIRIGRISEL